ncbi:MAG: heme NO-binding protein, partial [Pseudomonadota bacterium]
MEPVRRLLRFGGVDFADFLDSLDELPERARLAVPSLVLPAIDVHEVGYDEYQIFCRSEFGRFGKILAGALRAMADDYGCLSLIEWDPGGERGEEVTLTLLDGAHSEGKSFVLGAEAGV